MGIQEALDSAVKGFNESYEEGLRQGRLEMDSLKFKYETAITAMRIKDKKYDTLNGQYKALEKITDEMEFFLTRLSRCACLSQIWDDNKCHCFSCEAQMILKKLDR